MTTNEAMTTDYEIGFKAGQGVMRKRAADLVQDYFDRWRERYVPAQSAGMGDPGGEDFDMKLAGPGGLVDIVLVKRLRALEIERL